MKPFAFTKRFSDDQVFSRCLPIPEAGADRPFLCGFLDSPHNTRVLFASSRESGRQRYSQFYLVSVTGGFPEKLPVP